MLQSQWDDIQIVKGEVAIFPLFILQSFKVGTEKNYHIA